MSLVCRFEWLSAACQQWQASWSFTATEQLWLLCCVLTLSCHRCCFNHTRPQHEHLPCSGQYFCAVPCRAVLCCAVLCCAVLCCAMPCSLVPCCAAYTCADLWCSVSASFRTPLLFCRPVSMPEERLLPCHLQTTLDN